LRKRQKINLTGTGARILRSLFRPAFWVLVIVTVVLPSCQQYINNPAPVLTSLSPANIQAQSPDFQLTLKGNYLTPSSIVQWQPPTSATPIPLQAIFETVNVMTAYVPGRLVQNPGQVTVTVFTPQPGGGTSLPIYFNINPRPSPVPQITAINPTVAYAGSGGATVTVLGTGFVTQSVVEVNGENLTTTYSNPSTLQVSIPASDMTTAGPLGIAVLNPSPGGGLSNTFDLNLQNPVPQLISISPTGEAAGAAAISLSVTGSGFTLASSVLVNGTALITTPTSSAQLNAQMPASLFSQGQIYQITVSNPAPGGGVSNILTFPVNATASAGLPILVDYAYQGALPINGICGTITACQTLNNGLEPLITSGPSASQTGEDVAFASISANMVLNDSSPQSQIFFRDTCFSSAASCVPLTTIASVDQNGNPANGPSAEPTIASGGGDIAFSSLATNLVPTVPVSGKYRQIYWIVPCQTASGCTTVNSELVSISADGLSEGNGDSYSPVISPDGRYVAFVSLATNLASNVTPDGVTPQVYVTDTCSGVESSGCSPTTYLVSTPDGITPANAPSSHPAISNAGEFVTFTSSASNLGSQAPNPSRVPNVFQTQVCYAGQTTCVLSTTLVSTPDGATPANGTSDYSTVSNNGRFIAFQSTATNLIPGDGPTQQIYVRDTCLTDTVTGSCAPTTYLVSTSDGTTPANALSERPSMSTSGQYIAFASQATNLSPLTANGFENIFARNTCLSIIVSTVTTCTTSTVLVSQPPGTQASPSNGDSLLPVIGAEGHVVAFLSFSSNLVPNDTNGANKIADVFLGSTTF
jgi:WD40-like Beta Propeller Repeat